MKTVEFAVIIWLRPPHPVEALQLLLQTYRNGSSILLPLLELEPRRTTTSAFRVLSERVVLHNLLENLHHSTTNDIKTVVTRKQNLFFNLGFFFNWNFKMMSVRNLKLSKIQRTWIWKQKLQSVQNLKKNKFKTLQFEKFLNSETLKHLKSLKFSSTLNVESVSKSKRWEI